MTLDGYHPRNKNKKDGKKIINFLWHLSSFGSPVSWSFHELTSGKRHPQLIACLSQGTLREIFFSHLHYPYTKGNLESKGEIKQINISINRGSQVKNCSERLNGIGCIMLPTC